MSKKYPHNLSTLEDYEGEAIEAFESFLSGFTVENKLLRIPDENKDYFSCDGDPKDYFIYTNRGSRLAYRMLDKLGTLGIKLFPGCELDLNIESHMFRELD